MLPDGFAWIRRGQYAGEDLALTLHGEWVAMLMRKANGVDWCARLDCHHGIHAPVVTRPCSSFDAGKAGIEAWAIRHHARLLAEIGRGPAPLPRA